jgi:hypothetical protein
VVEIVRERGVRLHACATCPTHVHVVVSFRSTACTCGALRFCQKDCPARRLADAIITRMKRKMGQALAKMEGTSGRPWFSRGWDRTRVKDEEHLKYLLETYLPDHEATQAGIFRKYS